MTEEQKAIFRNAIVVFNGDVIYEDLKHIPEGFRGDIIVHGDIVADGDFNLSGSLYCEGRIYSDNLTVNGDLYCECDIHSDNITVGGYFISKSNIDSYDIKVAEEFYCTGCEINLNSSKIIARVLETDSRIKDCKGIEVNNC